MTRQLLGLLLIGLCAFVSAADLPEEDGVVILTDDTFDDFVAANPFILVEFYAPWCGHCKKLAPEFAKAAKALKSHEPPVPLAKVDATAEKKVGERFEIKGYPTLKFFTNGQPIEFNGGRTDTEIVDWIRKKLLPPSSELRTADAAEKIINDNEVAVIYFGELDTAEHQQFIAAARAFDDIVFAHASDASIASKYQIEDLSSPKVVLFKKFDEGRNDFTGTLNADELKKFVEAHFLPLIIPFNQKAAQKIFGEGHPALFLFHEGGDAGTRAHEAIKEAAGALTGKILLSVSGVLDGLPKRLAEYVGVTERDIPTVRIVDPASEEMLKFTLQGDITADSIIQFYEDWVNKRLKPIFKSAEVPESNDEPVKVIVGTTFKDIVLDESKDVLMEFYAPWCGHCKQLVPIYDSLAKRLSHIPNLVIAKMDATANEVEGVKVQGFPTIKFFPTNRKKNPIDFSGDRTEEGFLKFLKEQMTVPFLEAPGETQKTDL